ncbi:MAG: nicotinate phosphoribosyltransferase, partial [Thiotrichaceae bacterium]
NSGATVVIRPDSGKPEIIVPDLLKRLYASFGGCINNKVYVVLDNAVRLIQGDGVDKDSIKLILQSIAQAGFSTENVAFGMGGGLLQKVNRDTLSFAMKASAVQIKGQWQDAYKQPITDAGKTSKRGRLAVIQHNNTYQTIREDALNGQTDLLRCVYRNGELLIDESFDVIRARSNQDAIQS